MSDFGIESTFLDTTDLSLVEKAMKPNTKVRVVNIDVIELLHQCTSRMCVCIYLTISQSCVVSQRRSDTVDLCE